MNLERFKIEMTRGVQSLLPWAMEHKKYRNLPVSQVMTPESQYEFPPFHMLFTVEVLEGGVEFPMVSISAPLRPVKILSWPERDAAKEVMKEIWQAFTVIGVRNFTPSSAFKVVALPVDCPSPVMDFYKKLAI